MDCRAQQSCKSSRNRVICTTETFAERAFYRQLRNLAIIATVRVNQIFNAREYQSREINLKRRFESKSNGVPFRFCNRGLK